MLLLFQTIIQLFPQGAPPAALLVLSGALMQALSDQRAMARRPCTPLCDDTMLHHATQPSRKRKAGQDGRGAQGVGAMRTAISPAAPLHAPSWTTSLPACLTELELLGAPLHLPAPKAAASLSLVQGREGACCMRPLLAPRHSLTRSVGATSLSHSQRGAAQRSQQVLQRRLHVVPCLPQRR